MQNEHERDRAIKILICTRSGILAMSLRPILERAGHSVVGHAAGAVAAMNVNRRLPSVALPDLTVPTSGDVSTQIRDMILQERFATMFAEGSRLQDIYRFNLVNARLGPGRATKLPLSRTEELTNPHLGEGKETCPAVS